MIVRFLLLVLLLPFFGCNGLQSYAQPKILPGAFQMQQYLPLIQGKSIGVVANNASMIHSVHLVDTLLTLSEASGNFKIKRLFSPEHGFSGTFDAGGYVDNEKSLFDSIDLVSLYGKNRKPARNDLEGLDIIIFDLQDVGVRFFTYISTLHYVMQACAENNVMLIVLDRPNPHTDYIDGPILEDDYKSFVGIHPVPVIYGMTIGEYAQMINGERWHSRIECDLNIINLANYKRGDIYIYPEKPSPNLPDMESVLLYPSTCLFEGTVFSEGRGTRAPFRIFGHPEYPDTTFSFVPVRTPGASLYPKFQNEKCYGVSLEGLSLDTLMDFNKLNLEYILSSYKKMEMGEDFFIPFFNTLCGTDSIKTQIIRGDSEEKIRASWKPGLDAFQAKRQKYLIYPE
jgi:uncharacterized protein YbbC (DUF1343 family)